MIAIDSPRRWLRKSERMIAAHHLVAQSEPVARSEHAPAGPPDDSLGPGADLRLSERYRHQLRRGQRSGSGTLSVVWSGVSRVGLMWIL
jgi:hypothetical protein